MAQYLGRPILKEFKGFGKFAGRVAGYHKDTGFRVQYEDGDTEDVTEKELLRSIDEVDAKLQDFRKKVQAVLTDLQGQGLSKADTPQAESGV